MHDKLNDAAEPLESLCNRMIPTSLQLFGAKHCVVIRNANQLKWMCRMGALSTFSAAHIE